ncbi:NTP transferase domain-containing protein [Streptomyces sp. NPDC092296]|uniref:NTP transferase domain-containing protein n=1 Tax=Streptomyces sp. NPDC092296 TaxID=3366012 RepID=UPI00381B125B
MTGRLPADGATAGPDPAGPVWTALVPAKPFALAKSRCADLTPAARRALARAMLTDVVTRLGAVPSVHAVVVVGGGPEVAGTALASGAAAFSTTCGPGLNAETADALAALAGPARRFAVVMGDLPGAAPADFAAALAAAGRHGGAALVADAEGTGTTLLALPGPQEFRPFLGPGSRGRFLAAGYRELDVPAASPLRRDIDTVRQLRALPQATLGPATRAWLAAREPDRPAARTRIPEVAAL